MEYNLATSGALWSGGIFNIPKSIVDNYIKLASEYQLKALLIILSGNGRASAENIAEILGMTAKDAENIMQFWVNEGVVAVNNTQTPAPVGAADTILPNQNPTVGADTIRPQKTPKKEKLTISAPVLSPKEIVAAIEENDEIAELMNEAQTALGRSISHAEQEMLVNLVNFYGMKSEIILMILGYCRAENERGKKITTAYIIKIAENWIDEGIDTISAAEEKLCAIEQSDRLWNEILSLLGMRRRNPSQKQRDMVLEWNRDFSFDMIALAIETALKNEAAKPLTYTDKILKNWKKEELKTPDDVNRAEEKFRKSKDTGAKPKNTKTGEISRKPSYDLEQIKKDAMSNTDIKY